jgi:hypothetical protein
MMTVSNFILKGIFLLLLLSNHDLIAAVSVGCVATWSNDKPIVIEVPIQATEVKVFGNNQVTFPNAPQNLKSQGGARPWCFPIDDERFAYVHTLYYATQQIDRFQKLATKLGVQPLNPIAFDLVKVDREMPAGGSQHGSIMLRIPVPAIDPTVIAHEVGHEIHYHMAGFFVDQLVGTSMKESKWQRAMEQLGVIEGTANLISALFTGQSRMGAFSYRDAAIDIDSFVRFPDVVPTVEFALSRFTGALGFRAAYPKSVQTMEEALKTPYPALKQTLNLPDAYLASAVINQPMWKAAIQFGFDRVELLYLSALRDFVNFQSYSDLARRLEKMSEPDVPVNTFLKSEFLRRGL